MLLVEFALPVVKIFAFVNSLLYSAAAYDAAYKFTKPAWRIILGFGFVVQMVMSGALGLVGLAFTIAAFGAPRRRPAVPGRTTAFRRLVAQAKRE